MKKFLAFMVMIGASLGLAAGQAISTNGGSIQGTITDPTGAAVPGASIVISSPDTGYSRALSTDSAGLYSLGPLVPGNYTITVTAPSFQRVSVTTVVRTGTVTSGNAKLVIGNASETIEVNAGAVQVNTDQIGVAGVITTEQINSLPINGRNILDVAQLEPGVILQSGQDFDPTKTGYSAIGVSGQNGRSTRILVDGQDISDETVGTVLFNVPQGAVGEFQLNRSTQDVSGSVTSTGQVLIATQSGTNRYHGNVFGNFQDDRAGFANVNGAPAPFQRNQFGGYVGGYVWRDKLFFFGGAERIKQFDSSPVNRTQANFAAIYNQYPVVPDPFKDTFSVGRLDFHGPWGVNYFVRATYSTNAAFATAGQAPYALYQNQDNIPAIVGGADFVTGKFTHSARFGYIKFVNNLHAGANALGNTVYNPSNILGFPFELIGAIYAGAGNEDAPQNTYQSSKQFRYDGTWTKGAHNVKYGGEVTRILQGGFAAFYSTFLSDVSTSARFRFDGVQSSTNTTGAGCNNVVGAAPCLGDPLNGYRPVEFVFGNGNGSGSERPGFGLPGGGNFSWRLAAYVGDTWKISPSFTLVAGLRWSVDTDRANQDLPGVNCGDIDASLQFSGCDSTTPTKPLFDFFGPGLGLGGATQQNYANFGPQAGFVYSPSSHKFVLRAGAGIYYENDLFNNQSNVRAQNTKASFPSFNYGLTVYNSPTLSLPGYKLNAHGVTSAGVPCNLGSTTSDPGCISLSTIYTTMTLAQATTLFAKTDNLYKAAAAAPQPNVSYIGFLSGDALQAENDYSGAYKTPYALQYNGGMQYELMKGMVVSADYIHNATFKVPLTVDTNHVGAARYLNVNAAKAAIAAVAGGTSATAINAAIANGKTIDDFAGAGLDSGNQVLGGYPASANGVTPDTGAAFPGANPNVGAGNFILPIGKSAYDALQIVLRQQKSHPVRGIVSSNLQVAYNLSRAQSNSKGGSNQFFAGSGAFNQDCVNCYFGRTDADRSNQLTMGGSAHVKYGLEVALVGHFFSAAPENLTLAGVTGSSQIFKTDVDGDGTTGDLIPGTRPGAYMHEIKGAGLSNLISNYNATQAGTLTPAGQALVNAGLFTVQQLTALKAVKQPLTPAPVNPIQNSATRTLDASVKYPIGYLKRFREGLVITPGVAMYNVANMSNYSNFSGLLDTTATPASILTSNALNGPNTQDVLNRGRVLRGAGNGTFDQGGPRSTEFSLKIEF